MTPKEFIIWLDGLLEGTNQLEGHHLLKIKSKLKNVNLDESIRYIPDYPRVENKELVPYSTICSCNPANGGSGICGCIIGNKLVPRDGKSNIYTTTTENIPFNWQYKDPTKQILHD
jgi:hypothetical protein